MLALIALAAASQDVFVSGTEGFDTYRIPAIARASNGDLLAFCEARTSVSDQAENRIVMKRRLKGKSAWSPVQLVAEQSRTSLNNPCVLTLPRGRVLLMYQAYPAGTRESNAEPGFDGPKTLRAYLLESRDNGATWGKAQEITRQARRAPEIRTVCSGPGIGIRLESGRHKGRLVFPFNEREGREWRVFALFSDDEGKSWKAGAPAPQPDGESGNEVQMAQIGPDRILLNARNQGKTRHRLQAVSSDGGETWGRATLVPGVNDPVCMGSIVRVGGLLAFSNPDDTRTRVNGTIWTSTDQGATWTPKVRVPEPSFAYSCLVPLGRTRVGCLYETVPDRQDRLEKYIIRFAEFDLAAR